MVVARGGLDARFQRAHLATERRELRSLRKKLKAEPESHWLLTRIASTYYELRNYRRALEYSQRALAVQPRCPLARWDRACALDMLGQKREAIAIWTHLIRRGPERLAYGRCGEGTVWARALVRDSHYRRGLTRADLGDLRGARSDLNAFVQLHRGRREGVFTRREARRVLALLASRSHPHA